MNLRTQDADENNRKEGHCGHPSFSAFWHWDWARIHLHHHVSVEQRIRKFFLLTFGDSYITWDWAEGNSWLAGVHNLPIFIQSKQIQRHLWMCTLFYVVNQQPLVYFDGSDNHVFSVLIGQWKQTERNVRCGGCKMRVWDWVSACHQNGKIMRGVMVPEYRLGMQFWKHMLIKKQTQWKRTKQDQADVSGNCFEPRIV